MNLGIIKASEATSYIAITEKLQQVDSDTLEATSASQYRLIFFIIGLGIRGIMEERNMSIISTYTQRLKQLGFSLDSLEAAEPPIFIWMIQLLTDNSRASLGIIRSTLQIVLSFGADINARWLGLPPLIYLFLTYERIDTGNEESNTRIMTDTVIALLENGVDLLALSDNGLSVFSVAEWEGLTSELALALQETGHDLDDVRQKIDLAQWRFRNPGHSLAESTAVDHSQIEPPSTAGLVSRRAVAGDRLEE